MARTQQEINEAGFKALVNALGKEDALRFVRYIGYTSRGADQQSAQSEDEVLPAMTPDEIHQLIMDMHEPDDQASLL